MNRYMRRNAQDFRIKLLGGEYATHMTCEEAQCEANAKGWLMALNVTGAAGHAEFANWVKASSGRRFWEWRSPGALEEALRQEARGEITVTPELRQMLASLADGMLVFAFPPGQQCFKVHEDREVVFQHVSGTMVPRRDNPAFNRFADMDTSRVHTRPIDWNEHMNEEAAKVNEALKRG